MSVGMGQALMMAVWPPCRFLHIASRMQRIGRFLGHLSFKQSSWAGAELGTRYWSWFCESLWTLNTRPLEADFASLACGNYQTRSRDWGFLNGLVSVQLMRTASSWGNCGWSEAVLLSVSLLLMGGCLACAGQSIWWERARPDPSVLWGCWGKCLPSHSFCSSRDIRAKVRRLSLAGVGLAWTRGRGLQGDQHLEPLGCAAYIGDLELWLWTVPHSSGQAGSESKGWQWVGRSLRSASGQAIQATSGKVSLFHWLQFSFLSSGEKVSSLLAVRRTKEISSNLVRLPAERRSGHELGFLQASRGTGAQRLTDYSLRQESWALARERGEGKGETKARTEALPAWPGPSSLSSPSSPEAMGAWGLLGKMLSGGRVRGREEKETV